jgi:hypothetical protein
LARFWDAFLNECLPAELHKNTLSYVMISRLVTLTTRMPMEAKRYGYSSKHLSFCYEQLMDQMSPESHEERFAVALKALAVLREFEVQCNELDWTDQPVFSTGFGDGLNQIGLAGCLIDEVEMKFRGNQSLISAYVKGWDFGKAKRPGLISLEMAA